MSNEPTAAEIARAKRKAKLLAREKQLNAGQHIINTPVPQSCDKDCSPEAVKTPEQIKEEALKEELFKK